jgi:aspartate aminotransferase
MTTGPLVQLNLGVRGMARSATLDINERSEELIRQGKEVFKLGLGQSPFPIPAPVVDALRANAHQKQYLEVVGLRALREAVADYHHRKHGISRSADDVLIGPGSKELMFLVQLVYYGDLVIPTPSWVSYAPQAQIIGRHVRWLSTRRDNKWQLTPDELDELCRSDPDRPRLLILNYPNNPSGYTYSREELQELAATAQRYRLVLLSDEIYGEIHHRGDHVSIAEYYPEGTIISSGLSKWCGAGGWRLGTFTFPSSLDWLRSAMASVASETYTSTSAPIQYAAIRAFQGDAEIEDYLVHCRRILGALGRHCARRLAATGIRVAEPDGAYYLFPSFTPFKESMRQSGIKTSKDLCDTLLEQTGVATIPGVSFGRPLSEMTLRLAYVDFDGAAALDRSRQVAPDRDLDESFLTETCGRVTRSIDLICEWTGRFESE